MYEKSFFSNLRSIKNAMLSGKPSAYLTMLYIFLVPFSRIIDYFVQRVQLENKIPKCLMLVSLPRSGSTTIFQVLVRSIPCVYITNLHTLFPVLATWYLEKKDLFGKQLKGISNYYGYTSGLNDINEGNNFINQIFCGNPDKQLIRERFVKLLRLFETENNAPFVFKNVRNYDNIQKLSEAVPEIVFVRISRNTEQVIQSELKAYHEHGYFNPIPEELKDVELEPVEFCIRQILAMEKKINLQKRNISKSSWMEFTYEDFCDNPDKVISIIAKKLSVEKRVMKETISLSASFATKVNPNEEQRIRELLPELMREYS